MANNLKHLMIDIETMGTTSNSVICSIAAVQFDLKTGMVGHSFFDTISIQSCLDVGLKIDADTLKWWLGQSDKAREMLFVSNKPLPVVLIDFNTFLAETYGIKEGGNLPDIDSLQIWGNGSRFDLGILGNAFRSCGMPIPWLPWNERDVRTLVSLAPQIKKQTEFEGVKHNPLHDCLHQIDYCSKTYQYIFKTL